MERNVFDRLDIEIEQQTDEVEESNHNKDTVVQLPKVNFKKEKIKLDANLCNIGNSAIWSVSSARLESGIDFLMDANPKTFWQSNGNIPHYINMRWARRVFVQSIVVVVNVKEDDSYCPSKISVRYTTDGVDLIEKGVISMDTDDNVGVIVFQPVLWTFHLQFCILENFLKGRDSRIRGLFVLGPSSIRSSPPND